MVTTLKNNSRDQLLKKQIEKQMKLIEKKAKVNVSDLKLLKINVILMLVSLLILVAGALIVYFLFVSNDGINAYSRVFEQNLFDSTSSKYFFFVGSHFGAVIIGIGIFLMIGALVSFSNDYELAKKQAINNLIEIERQKNKKEETATVNIFDALALVGRNRK